MSSQALAIRALLWKEWRQQRALFGILVGAGLLAILSGFWWRPFYAVGLAATLVWGCGPLLFASNVFAGETDAGTRTSWTDSPAPVHTSSGQSSPQPSPLAWLVPWLS